MQPAAVLAPKTYIDYIHEYFPSADWQIAEAVCMAESHCRSDAIGYNTNNTFDSGVFQINSVHAGKVGGNLQALLDPETNVRVAAQIKAGSGWGAWSTINNKKYLQYLK